MKKTLSALVLCISLILAVFSGCGKSEPAALDASSVQSAVSVAGAEEVSGETEQPADLGTISPAVQIDPSYNVAGPPPAELPPTEEKKEFTLFIEAPHPLGT